MKKALTVCLILLMLLTGCNSAVEHVEPVEHVIMEGTAITIPDDATALAKAIYEATDLTANIVIDKFVKKKPEFISFEFSSDVLLSDSEKSTLKQLFACYGVEITDGLRSELSEIEHGITIGYSSIQQTQLEDCDLTIPVKIYYGNDIYTYCCDFKMYRGEYVLFRYEYLHRTRYIF